MSADTPQDKSPGLLSANPTAALALLAAGTGMVALVSLGIEILTGAAMARAANLGVAYLSAPLGVATLVLAGLSARQRPLWALPAVIMCVIYWALFALTA